jgi:outer membrane immunogenic protein
VNIGYGFSGRAEEPGNTINTDGFLGGAFVGYNYQMDNFVLGAEGDIGYNGVKGDNAGVESKGGVEGSLRARLGYSISPDILLYGTAGGAGQSVKITDATGSDRNTMFGWTAGVGTDIKLTDNVFGRVEYRYTDYGSEDFNIGGATRAFDARDNRVTFGVGMKF